MKTAWLIKPLLPLQSDVCSFNMLSGWLIRQGRVLGWCVWGASSAVYPRLTMPCLGRQPGRSHIQLEVTGVCLIPWLCAPCWCNPHVPPHQPHRLQGLGVLWVAIKVKPTVGRRRLHRMERTLYVIGSSHLLRQPWHLIYHTGSVGASRQWLCNQHSVFCWLFVALNNPVASSLQKHSYAGRGQLGASQKAEWETLLWQAADGMCEILL